MKNKVAWVTGASSGIGRACAIELARRGVHVGVSARREERLADLVVELERQGVSAVTVPCDVCDDDSVARAAARVVSTLGGLDIALANAGCTQEGTIEELGADDWKRLLDVNVVGAATTARYALPFLRERRGRLALTGSVAGFMVAPGWGAYHASKYALRALGRTLSAELAGSGVSCTTVHPGFVESDIMRVDASGETNPNTEDPRPTQLMWSAQRAARVMIDAIERRRRELVFTGHGKVAVWLGTHFPSAMHAVMAMGPMVSRSNQFRKD